MPRQFNGKGLVLLKNGAGIITHSNAKKERKKKTFHPHLPSCIKINLNQIRNLNFYTPKTKHDFFCVTLIRQSLLS